VTPLLLAVERGMPDMAKLLLDHGADIEAKQREGFTPLLLAVASKLPGMVEVLASRGANMEARLANGVTPLLLAVERGMPDMAKLLLDHGADIEAKQREGFTPLLLAAQYNHLAALQLLLDCGADMTAKLSNGSAALGVALAGGHAGIAAALLDQEAPLAVGPTPVFLDAGEGQQAIAAALRASAVRASISSQASCTYNTKVLLWAATHGRSTILELMIKRGVDPDLGLSGSMSALDLCSNEACRAVLRRAESIQRWLRRRQLTLWRH